MDQGCKMMEAGGRKTLRMRVDEIAGGETRVFLEGELDRETVPDVRKRLLRAARQEGFKQLAVNFSQINRMDTAGVAVMVEVLQAVSRGGRMLCVDGLSEEAKRLFRLARLEETFCVGDEPRAQELSEWPSTVA
jgi:anti-anti-sigma factor